MPENSTMPFTITLLILALILLVFAMKYGAQFIRDRAEAAKSTDTDVKLAALDEKSRALEKRVAHLEAMLREVE